MVDLPVRAFDFNPRTRVVFGRGALDQLGELARELGFARTLLVADPGMVAVGYVDRATSVMNTARIDVFPFHDFAPNPDTDMIETARRYAASASSRHPLRWSSPPT